MRNDETPEGDTPRQKAISIHSLRVEGDRCGGFVAQISNGFQSTPSVWRETTYRGNIGDESRFQSTPSVWRETLLSCCNF